MCVFLPFCRWERACLCVFNAYAICKSVGFFFCALLNVYVHVSVPLLHCHVCVYVQYAVYVEPSPGVYINEHLSVSLMPDSIWPPILCVQLIARTSAGVCVFLTLANRSMALHTNVPLHQPRPCQPLAHKHS